MQRGNSFISLYPSDRPRLTVGLDHHIDAPIIGKQWVTWCPLEDEHFRWTIGAARWYAPTGQVSISASPPQHVPAVPEYLYSRVLLQQHLQTLPGQWDVALFHNVRKSGSVALTASLVRPHLAR